MSEQADESIVGSAAILHGYCTTADNVLDFTI